MKLTDEEVIRILEAELKSLIQQSIYPHSVLKQERQYALTQAIQSLKDYAEVKGRMDEEKISPKVEFILSNYVVYGSPVNERTKLSEEISKALVSYLRGERENDNK